MQNKLQSILARAAAPFCIFSLVLLGSLGVIRLTVVPLLTRVEINGEQQQLGTLLNRHAELTASLMKAESERSALVLPVKDPAYLALKAEQQAQQDYNLLFAAVEQLAREAQQEGKPTVFIQQMSIDYAAKTARLRGDVRNAGQSSLSVLAWFVDSLRLLPLLADTPTPPFERQEDPYIGLYSPFDLEIPLRVHE